MRQLWLVGVLALGILPLPAHASSPQAWLVCNGSTAPCPEGTQFHTIQSAVDAASPGDWVLVWPGVYHEKDGGSAGVLIAKPGLHVRGLDRNLVIVDGSNGPASKPCPSDPVLQDFTPRDGIVVSKASGTHIENLTVCDYLASASGSHGNEIWWNGGDGSGQLGIGTYEGSYLSVTSQYAPARTSSQMAQYGLFVSNASGPGSITHSYASNMGDAGVYVGACQQICHALLDRVHVQNSALGFSGTNAGNYVIRDSEWDHNRTGLAPNSLNNDDSPPPQNGLCPGTTSQSCTFIEGNFIHDNNNANAPTFGLQPAVGAGIEISGGQFDTIRFNRIERQGAWGVVTHDFPDPETPPPLSHCQGGIQQPGLCLFIAMGNRTYGNLFSGNGFFGNPTNGDLANESMGQSLGAVRNCFFGNTDVSGPLTSDPANIESRDVDGPPCDRPGPGDSDLLLGELVCATGFATCPIPGASYPQQTQVTILPLSRQEPMPDPCRGAPANAFCDNDRYLGPGS